MQLILGLCQGLPEQSFAAGEVLIPEGSATGRLFIPIEGEIEIRKGELPLHVTVELGAVFGEISALLDIPHTATVKALTPAPTHPA